MASREEEARTGRDTAEQEHVNTEAEEKLLTQIREDFRYCREYWRENHDEAEKDMDCVAGIPPVDFRDDRKGRPCIWPDEISQYTKQSCNNLRQNKRGIKISPKGMQAQDVDAEHRQAYIDGIQDASNAQAVFSTGYEAAVNSGSGHWRVTTKVTGPKGEQEPRLVRIPNQFTVYRDPNAQEADYSDSNLDFILDSLRQKDFLRQYPTAQKRSFTAEDMDKAADWVHGDNIVIAEYWIRKSIEAADGEQLHKVRQYLTNGVEILKPKGFDEKEDVDEDGIPCRNWIGSWIPIVSVFGEEIYVRNGGQHKRMFMSLVRRARGNQQMLSFIASQWGEEFGQAPRAPLIVYKGTVNPDVWKTLHKVPRAYAEYEAGEEWKEAWGPPPAPMRIQYQPNDGPYSAAYEQFRRAIQASMGITPLPTAAQRQNEKSGIAIEKIQNAEAVGSFHFTDNFDRALTNTGRQLNELITKLAKLDSLPKQVLGKDGKGEDKLLQVMPQNAKPQSEELGPESEHLPEADQFFAHRGEFEVTVSTGPNYQSEREEASSFADTLLQTIPQLGFPPQITQELLSMAVKLKNIGPIGDEIANLLSPPDPNNMPPQAKAAIMQAQGQIQQLTAQLSGLVQEKQAKVVEGQWKKELEMVKGAFAEQLKKLDNDVKMAVAEIQTKAQVASERQGFVEDVAKQVMSNSHDLGMQKDQQQHEAQQAQAMAANASAQSAQDAAQNQAAQQNSQEQGQ